ncbi:LacI family DNA-binding transcriptional regulator [Piscinibacter sakaiensis]|uniref:Regulatory protein, LacI n=1 Tax=Piscinibacter sakaiensis TaxID=1547922 RepID=A0A0K8NZE9_PISS1|nr:LacI family DNA-binding transcriptional regulator [Piscinibacter sakaiensis]GAP35782.1 regulatory protein, LacI [Piscinibacter sakaiensis]
MSLADVASLAGVSPGTVSRALSRPDMVQPDTRQRVREAAERLGYVANGAARALAMRRTATVGALIPRFGGSSFPSMVQALESTLAEHGYTLLLSAPDHARARDPALLRTLLERGVDAVALLGSDHPPAFHAMLAAHPRPCVRLWGAPDGPGPCVTFDEGAAIDAIVDHLAALGHRRLAFIGGRVADNERARWRRHGLLQAVARRGMTLADDAMIECDYGFREGHVAMQALLARRLPVTATLCGNDYLAAGALSALHAAGWEVPRRMSLAGFNDNDFAPFLQPPLTTVRVPIAEMGERAGLYLVDALAGRAPAAPALLAAGLVARGSTGEAPRG